MIVAFIFFILFGLASKYSFLYYPPDELMIFTYNNCMFFIVLFAFIYAYFSSFGYKENVVPFWKNGLAFIIMSILMMMTIFVSVEGIVLLVNSKIGNQKAYLLKGEIVELDFPENKKIYSNYSIEIYREFEEDTIDLVVPTNNYKLGGLFEKEFKVGCLDLLYLSK